MKAIEENRKSWSGDYKDVQCLMSSCDTDLSVQVKFYILVEIFFK
jgi:hypothetical protein